tara:strand:- start:3181 stop:4335 length:1155 start_codon:yes stop_codon:yes gene_type:complete
VIDFEYLLRHKSADIPQKFFKPKVLEAFLSQHLAEWLTLLRERGEIDRWVHNSREWVKIYEILVINYPQKALIFLSVEHDFEKGSIRFQKLLAQHLRSLKDSLSEVLMATDWIKEKVDSIVEPSLLSEIEHLVKNRFFEMSWSQVTALSKLVQIDQIDSWYSLHLEYHKQHNKKVYLDDLLWELPKIYLTDQTEYENELILRFLVNYHQFLRGWSRQYNAWKRYYPNLIHFWEQKIYESRNKIAWDLLVSPPGHKHLKVYLDSLAYIAKGRFMKELLFALILTIGLTLWLDSSNIILWLVLFVIFNCLEWVFANFKPNTLYYLYKFKIRLTKENYSHAPLQAVWMILNIDEIELSAWQKSILTLMSRDPWQLYPPLRKDFAYLG